MNRKPDIFQYLKILQNQIKSTNNIEEKKAIQKEYDRIKNSMPKYRPHVWKNNGL